MNIISYPEILIYRAKKEYNLKYPILCPHCWTIIFDIDTGKTYDSDDGGVQFYHYNCYYAAERWTYTNNKRAISNKIYDPLQLEVWIGKSKHKKYNTLVLEKSFYIKYKNYIMSKMKLNGYEKIQTLYPDEFIVRIDFTND